MVLLTERGIMALFRRSRPEAREASLAQLQAIMGSRNVAPAGGIDRAPVERHADLAVTALRIPARRAASIYPMKALRTDCFLFRNN